MTARTVCPVCGEAIDDIFVTDFHYCSACSVVVRVPDTIPQTKDRLNVYGSDWIERHDHNPIADSIASSLAGIVRSVLGNQTYADKKVMDIGCGSGILVDKLAKMGFDAHGIDWSQKAVLYAGLHKKGTYHCGDVTSTTWDQCGYFDLITASHILEHLEEPSPFLQSVYGMLVNGGWLIVSVPNLWWYDGRSRYRRISTIFDPEHVAGYSPKGLRMLLENNGFVVEGIMTVTHKEAFVPVVASATYRTLRPAQPVREMGRRVVAEGSVLTRTAGLVLAPLCRITGRRLRGMELTVVARRK